MAITVEQLLNRHVYAQLRDRDLRIRWSQAELTQYLNMAMRDLVTRRPEAGVHEDVNLPMDPGALQTLPSNAVRLKEIICNEP